MRMKTIILFENEELSFRENTRILETVRTRCPDAFIILISAGDFSSAGLLLEPSGRERAAQAVRAGADLVLSLPTASVLGGYGKKEFAGMALVQRLRTPAQIVLPCVPEPGQTPLECGEMLRSTAMLMFREMNGYRKELSLHLNENLSFRDAQKATVCSCFPQAASLLEHPQNRHALWLLDAMLQLYFMEKPEYIALPECEESSECPADADPYEQSILSGTRQMLPDASFETLIDISGSTTQLVSALLEKKDEIASARSLQEIVTLLQPAPEDRTRLFLLKSLLGIRKIYMQICGLHVYVPYCYASAKNPEKEETFLRLKENSWVPFASDPDTEDPGISETYFYLLQADKKAQELTNSPPAP